MPFSYSIPMSSGEPADLPRTYPGPPCTETILRRDLHPFRDDPAVSLSRT